MMNINRLILNTLLFTLILALPACSNTQDEPKAEAKPEIKKEATKDQAAQKPQEDENLPEIKVGDNVKTQISNIVIKNTSGKESKLEKYLGDNKTLITIVKPGCVFCESMLAIKSATGTKIKPKFLVIMDSSHADFNQFKEKHDKFKSAGGEWLLDINDDMKNKLGVVSYPRFILIDKEASVIAYQTGLVMPQDQTELQGKAFPEVLQKLSEETMLWMKGL